MRHPWRWRKPPTWLRLALRKRRKREDRIITIMGLVYTRPDPAFPDKWRHIVAKTKSAAGLPFDD